MSFKTAAAYELGARLALVDHGLLKLAEDDPDLYNETAPQDNPAEQLAAIFRESRIAPSSTSPDNKTPVDTKREGLDPHWGSPMEGTNGADRLQQMVPGFHMPSIGSV